MRVDISYRSVWRVLGELLMVEAALLLLPLVFELADGEGEWGGFAVACAVSAGAGAALRLLTRRTVLTIRRREGFMLVSLVWVVFSLVGMIPFMMCAHPLGAGDAFFETVSGFTTTGATTIADVEQLSRGVLLWRSMTQWIGGLGIVLFVLAVLPQLNENGGIPMYNAETTGITHDKIHPRIRQTASALWGVYGGLTLALALLLWAGPMDWFDALNHALTAVSTGGYSTKNLSIAYWHSAYIDVVMTVFMFVGGVNFGLLYGACRGRWRDLWRNDVLRAYAAVVAAAYLLTLSGLLADGEATGWRGLLVEPLFHLVSDITTTGYSLADFSLWGPLCLLVTVLLMICGACAGSTSGAVKIDRFVALWRNLKAEVKLSLYPRRVLAVHVNGVEARGREMSRVMAFMTLYALLAVAGGLCLCACGWGLTDSFFASLSCLGNNGLGYGVTGAAGGYHLLPEFMKWVMSFMMLAGRLELFSLIVLFFPVFWRK